jgi:hypothetical protein
LLDGDRRRFSLSLRERVRVRVPMPARHTTKSREANRPQQALILTFSLREKELRGEGTFDFSIPRSVIFLLSF